MNLPIAIWGDAAGYSVAVPNLPGCVSAGHTLDAALLNAKEAIEFHLEGMAEDGEPVPRPARLEELRKDPEFADALWAIVAVEPPKSPRVVKRLNITLPQKLLETVDRFAQERGETRSGLLAQAVSQYIGARSAAAKRRVSKKRFARGRGRAA